MKIYVASSWRNKYQPAIVEFIRIHGHEAYDFRNPEPGENGFAWSQIDPDWQSWTPDHYREALSHPLAEKGFSLDFNGMERSDVCLLLLPCGRSAHTEAAFMKGQGKYVAVYIPEQCEPELMYKIFDQIITSLDQLREFLNREK